ncbi:TPA: hypothetical protein ACH1TP_002914 [Enterobacter roggenkampii]|uniref:hypothetical protein n=1 Tax=Enterobacteriaceae TaxID=543 RepID=UPI00193D73CE|nr:hypothetical protein [Lelliottia sp. RWM.1]MBM3072358.1 hypothetical protein [Lelliottia sp. RWM.1]
MFKSFNKAWLKQALLRILPSGWLLLALIVLSLVLCNAYGRQAFLVWWCAFSGVALIGFSIALGNLQPSRLLKPDTHIGRFAYFFAWLVWSVGVVFILLSPILAEPLRLIGLPPLGAVTSVLFCRWVLRKGLLAWIQ